MVTVVFHPEHLTGRKNWEELIAHGQDLSLPSSRQQATERRCAAEMPWKVKVHLPIKEHT